MKKNMGENQLNVLLTGATNSTGKAIARKLCQQGANLVLVATDEQELYVLQQSLTPVDSQQSLHTFTCDITSAEEREQLKADIAVLPFSINVLVNNEAENQFNWFEYTSQEDMEKLFVTNVLAPMQLVQLFLPCLKRRDQAQVINIGSTFGSIGYPGYAAYCGSRFALRGFSQSLSRELADTNVKVKYLSARVTETQVNHPEIQVLNSVINTEILSHDVVADELLVLLQRDVEELHIGWAEKFLVKMNQLLPSVVAAAITKQLPIIKRYAINFWSLHS